MAKDFGKAGAGQKIQEVAKVSNERANLITIKYYKDEDLQDYPRNNEDINSTEDIEKSIEEQGFTDPIEITDFGCETGKFTIVSGHRRRVAGRNKGMKDFPCILRHFQNENEVYNYVLYSNAQRDSAKDPLLFAKRYKMHEEYLQQSSFKGSLREEIAKRLGISVQHADRYNTFNKIIFPVWDMVREEVVGMSSVLPMGSHTVEEQEEILSIFKDALKDGKSLTRDFVSKLIGAFRGGKKTYAEIVKEEQTEKLPVNSSKGEFINTEPSETREAVTYSRNDETNYDTSHREGLQSGIDPLAEERLTEEDLQIIESAKNHEEKIEKEKKPPLTEEEKKLANGEKINQYLSKLDGSLNEWYSFENKEKASEVITNMASVVKLIFAELETITDEYGIEEAILKKTYSDISKDLKSYQK